METRSIGSLQVTVVGVGTNNFGNRIDEERSIEVVEAALKAGINFFDTADVYGGTKSEEFLGRALGSRRDQAVIATKFGSPIDDQHKGAKPDYVRQACEDSLRRLGTDYIDLYQLHQPDPSTPIAETLGALDELVRAGKVREIGCSNFSGAQLEEADQARGDGARFVSVQNAYSLLRRDDERGVLPYCRAESIGYLPWVPLASGLLTGKYRANEALPEGGRITKMDDERRARAMNDESLAVVEALIAYAESKGHSILELAFSWLLADKPIPSVIAGATSKAQIDANVAAASWKLSESELAEIDKIAPLG